MNVWTEQAPSNIALIKYMGKQHEQVNMPVNASLSYTLDHLTTTVALNVIDAEVDQWAPLDTQDGSPLLDLTDQAIARFLQHLDRMKSHFGYQGALRVRSKNNFPQGAGIASSASSFAALTKCAATALSALTSTPSLSIQTQAQLSRMGSGSSCRSFYRPWCLWDGDQVSEVSLSYPTLLHQVVVVDDRVKQVSSSEAHRRVCTSPLFIGRAMRAESRLDALQCAFAKKAWDDLYRICFEEFMDMHQLFETAAVPFSYMTPHCRQLIDQITAHWRIQGDGPLVTMDAGSTIHLLYRPEQAHLAHTFKETVFKHEVVI